MLVCGIMSGTSLDGIDVAICEINPKGSPWRLEMLAFETYEMDAELRSQILKVMNDECGLEEISRLNFQLAHVYCDCVRSLCSLSNIEITQLAAIGCHGQTIFHAPRDNGGIGHTWQLGSGSALSQLIGINTVWDFRSADVALGGEGAPLVPIFDLEYLADDSSDVIALNIGGMANVTFLPAGCDKLNVRAFDTGPGNILINEAMQRLYGKYYDSGGKIAASGTIISGMLDELMQDAFVNQEPPKSTGRERYNYAFLESFISRYYLRNDLIATFTEFTACSIAYNISAYLTDKGILYYSGGGGHNTHLISRLKHHLRGFKVESTAQQGIDPDAKEALAFAYMALRTLNNLPSNLPSVTGASRETILGSVSRI